MKIFFSTIFKHLGIWTIPLVSMPLLFALAEQSSPRQDLSLASQQPSENFIATSDTTPAVNQQVAKSSTQSKAQNPISSKTAKKSQVNAKDSRKIKKRAQNKAKPHYTAPAVEIRVAIARNVPTLIVAASSSRAYISDAKGRLLHKLVANQGFQAQSNGSNILLGNWQLPSAIWIEPREGYVYVNERWYRGRVLLVAQGNDLLAVNYVDLEKYLYSVVGSEMHANAPLEALKAQAIAARSYALVHLYRPANKWYSLGDNERWQAYKGLSAEYNTTHQAVNSTAGELLSHQGGIFESLYAASDELVIKAHNGRGMSQTGAYKLAAMGYNYRQILANYYPGTQLARLELKR